MASRRESAPVITVVKWSRVGGPAANIMPGRRLPRGAEVFIFDDRTHGIDVHGKENADRLIDQLVGEGKTVLFISS